MCGSQLARFTKYAHSHTVRPLITSCHYHISHCLLSSAAFATIYSLLLKQRCVIFVVSQPMHAFECVCVFDIFFICFFCSYLSCLFFGNASNAFSWYLNAQTFCFHCFTFFYFFFFFYYFFIFSLASPPWHPLPSLSLCCYIFEVLFIVSSSRRGTFGCTNVCVAHTGTRTQTHSHIHLTSAYNFFLMLCCM